MVNFLIQKQFKILQTKVSDWSVNEGFYVVFPSVTSITTT